MSTELLSIGSLAKATGTKVETIRYYESIGLLAAPARTKNNYRAYTPQHLARLSFIRRARALGFSIDQVQELLELADQKDISCKAVDAIAREHLAEIDRKLRDLNTLRSELSNVIVQCGHGTISECRIIETLAPDSAAFS
ncbi:MULTISPECIES: MerR family transcriptional regulator [unclassified Sphingobium]|uniref:MerR family transcriptional regulator n=1 Tax=unclassified Sphingobium TaxID=2611147 RepID=UPI000D173B03|nr:MULTISPECIES: helix-turn-helix domain-containing protein [unclassified Sphingobium]PSO10426.1 MerR family transcriptional regulator [Sphingobium sp. AEW4]TWD03646.1 MerR family transcriptional regulator [Sphingobium sp. AEW010]TWD21151.1 MerR family transcriptional regulator [Sphingobium sp. AEW013]TWD23793.1 MerR family transcriptional regulator [Sphingobium sp. AEW001]